MKTKTASGPLFTYDSAHFEVQWKRTDNPQFRGWLTSPEKHDTRAEAEAHVAKCLGGYFVGRTEFRIVHRVSTCEVVAYWLVGPR